CAREALDINRGHYFDYW
nr:immunoglobulin heavy chain junction region [Macaca mulatta]MOX14725.1 immunoglobulin heavy chain junction region [Macaca mulatta]MOX14873.1 immunoglobulin heavy chain junction region [Macaca mulatta]MOX14934.1 immunoglobulin heavy chain junction region [Macaca mulatta]MOX15093.1 immunoglobulin heavy chain junction region [Macaca mulatta]